MGAGRTLAFTRWINNMTRHDDPKHAELRRPVAPEYTLAQMERLRPAVRQVIDNRLRTMLARKPPVDLVSVVAVPITWDVTRLLISGTEEDLRLYKEYDNVVGRTVNNPHAPVDRVRAMSDKMMAHLDRLISERERDPGDDVLGRIVASGQLGHDELIGTAWLLLNGGRSAVAHMIGLSTLSMLVDPALFRAITADPGLASSAVEEFLRYHSTVQLHVPRVATEDVPIGDVLIRAGDPVIISLSAVNRDERLFPKPDLLDIRRDAGRHLTFGLGVHVCLGQWLTRVELQEYLRCVVERVPTLELAVPLEQLRFSEYAIQYGVRELPVAW